MTKKIEARPYGPDSTPEEIEAIRARLTWYEPGILLWRELPVQTIFSVRIKMIRLGEMVKEVNGPITELVDLSEAAHVERELMLIKVRATGKDREEMKRMADIFRGRIIDVTESTYVIELTGASSKLDSFIAALDAGLILETVRTGVCGIGRGDRILKV